MMRANQRVFFLSHGLQLSRMYIQRIFATNKKKTRQLQPTNKTAHFIFPSMQAVYFFFIFVFKKIWALFKVPHGATLRTRSGG
jgi:hypothetical protein